MEKILLFVFNNLTQRTSKSELVTKDRAFAELTGINFSSTIKRYSPLIRQHEIYEVLGNEIPALRQELLKVDDVKSPYKVIGLFTKFTFLEIEKNNPKTVKKCLFLAEKILEEGDTNSRITLKNIFIRLLAKTFLNPKNDFTLPAQLSVECKKYAPKIIKKNKAE